MSALVKKCRRRDCRASWECRTCGAKCCEHMCSLKKPDKTASCSKCQASINQGNFSAFHFGADCQVNGGHFGEYTEQLARRYGYESWAKVPKKIRSEALRQFVAGKKAEKNA